MTLATAETRTMPPHLMVPGTDEPYELGHRPYWLFECRYCGAKPGEYCVLPSGKIRTTRFLGELHEFPHQVRHTHRKSGQWIAAAAYDVSDELSRGDELLVERSQWSPRYVVVERISDGYVPNLVLESHELYYVRESDPRWISKTSARWLAKVTATSAAID